MNNRLVTPELEKLLQSYPLYKQDGKKKDARCIAVFSLYNINWFVLEGEKVGDDYELYGIVTGLGTTEYGYFMASELEEQCLDLTKYGLGHARVIRDETFKPCPLGQIENYELQVFLSGLYDKKN